MTDCAPRNVDMPFQVGVTRALLTEALRGAIPGSQDPPPAFDDDDELERRLVSYGWALTGRPDIPRLVPYADWTLLEDDKRLFDALGSLILDGAEYMYQLRDSTDRPRSSQFNGALQGWEFDGAQGVRRTVRREAFLLFDDYINEETDMGPLDEEAMTAAPEPIDGETIDDTQTETPSLAVGDSFEDLENEDGPHDSVGDEEE